MGKYDHIVRTVMEPSFEIFPWQESFATGLPEIDEQHKRLVGLLNRLAGSLIHKAGMLELQGIFDELSDYAVYHFHTEEHVWHQHLAGDALEDLHKQSHDEFVLDVLKLKADKDSEHIHESLENALLFLIRWLTLHILDSDMRMAKVVLAVQAGKSLDQAKVLVSHDSSVVNGVLIDTVLAINDTLSARTMQLLRETLTHQASAEKHQLDISAHARGPDGMSITKREREIIAMVIAGYTSKEIAQQLAISHRTVEGHRTRIMQKTGASNLLELARIAEGCRIAPYRKQSA